MGIFVNTGVLKDMADFCSDPFVSRGHRERCRIRTVTSEYCLSIRVCY